MAKQNVMDIPELVNEIMQYSEWSAVVRVGNVNRTLKYWAQDIMQHRIRFHLGKFVENDATDRFWELLEASRGCIVGGLPRCIMADPWATKLHKDHPPLAMDIVMPLCLEDIDSTGLKFRRFLVATLDYEEKYFEEPNHPHKETTAGTFRLFSPVRI